ncbi:MAG: hypothetical protein Ct9H300mP19_05290 [Dehalococcoidia bacterium]|nr:MAG: hypothetical protein Ct9H300mP19_05290 [Dehalococcoidia bacterium]
MGGAVGLALGVLRMPALVHVLKMKPSLAAGTNLALTILVGTSGFTGPLISGELTGYGFSNWYSCDGRNVRWFTYDRYGGCCEVALGFGNSLTCGITACIL